MTKYFLAAALAAGFLISTTAGYADDRMKMAPPMNHMKMMNHPMMAHPTIKHHKKHHHHHIHMMMKKHKM